MVTLHTIDCSKCKVLEALLKKNNIQYETNRDVEIMKATGFRECPILQVDDSFYGFADAVKLVKEGKVS